MYGISDLLLRRLLQWPPYWSLDWEPRISWFRQSPIWRSLNWRIYWNRLRRNIHWQTYLCRLPSSYGTHLFMKLIKIHITEKWEARRKRPKRGNCIVLSGCLRLRYGSDALVWLSELQAADDHTNVIVSPRESDGFTSIDFFARISSSITATIRSGVYRSIHPPSQRTPPTRRVHRVCDQQHLSEALSPATIYLSI